MCQEENLQEYLLTWRKSAARTRTSQGFKSPDRQLPEGIISGQEADLLRIDHCGVGGDFILRKLAIKKQWEILTPREGVKRRLSVPLPSDHAILSGYYIVSLL